MENYYKPCNICSIKLTSENKAKRNQRCLECHSNIEKERCKEYRERNREACIERCKKYRETHKEEGKERCKQYNEAHKEEIKAKNSEKFKCDCGEMICNSSKAKHEKSSGHQAYLKYGDASKAEPNFYSRQKEKLSKIKLNKNNIY